MKRGRRQGDLSASLLAVSDRTSFFKATLSSWSSHRCPNQQQIFLAWDKTCKKKALPKAQQTWGSRWSPRICVRGKTFICVRGNRLTNDHFWGWDGKEGGKRYRLAASPWANYQDLSYKLPPSIDSKMQDIVFGDCLAVSFEFLYLQKKLSVQLHQNANF